MLKPVCDICHREVSQPIVQPFHFCDKHAGLAEEFLSQRQEALGEAQQKLVSSMESFRNRFLRRYAEQNRLEAVK